MGAGQHALGAIVRKITLGRYTYGYYRVMEMMAWAYCARAVGLFNDLPALLMLLGTLILFEGFRMFMEWRDIRAAIRYDEEVAEQAKKINAAKQEKNK